MYYCLCKNKNIKNKNIKEKNIENEDSDTYHLFECKGIYDKCGVGKTSGCKKEKLNDGYKCIFECENIDEVIKKVAELRNKGHQICGICVSTLYKNTSSRGGGEQY